MTEHTTIDGGNGGGIGKEIGQFSSIALDSNGYPHISYWGGYDNHDLRYAHFKNIMANKSGTL